MPRIYLRILHHVCLFVCLAAIGSASASAQPVPCATVTETVHRAAIVEAERWMAARWVRQGTVATADYALARAPSLPLGLGTFGATAKGGEMLGSNGATTKITGRISVTNLACATYEIASIGAGRRFAVRFTGNALRFDENARGWTRPLPAAVLHVLEVAAPEGRPGPAIIRDLPEAPTALPPDLQLAVK